jgi:small-conductance mechanosensitive channel
MAEYKHGDMNIDEQNKTFEGFIRWTTRVVIMIVGILLFLAIFAR